MIKYLLSTTLICSPLLAQRNGLDILGINSPRVKCSEIIKGFPSGNGLGMLWETFSNNTQCIEDLSKAKRIPFLRAHGINGAGLRNGQLQPFEPFYGKNKHQVNKLLERNNSNAMKIFSRNLRKTILLSKKIKAKCLYSPILEHDFSNKAIENVFKKLQGSRCKLVNNPNTGTGSTTLAYSNILEIHGIKTLKKTSSPCLSSNDGEIVSKSNVGSYLKKTKNCGYRFWWSSKFNLRKSGKFISPIKRKAYPTASYLRSLTELQKSH